eukprot:9394529-Karenia_brevis.AAC.1
MIEHTTRSQVKSEKTMKPNALKVAERHARDTNQPKETRLYWRKVERREKRKWRAVWTLEHVQR